VAEKIQRQIFNDRESAARVYRRLCVGDAGYSVFLRYEGTLLFLKYLPGALGLALRRWAWRGLFGRMGRGAVIGEGVSIRRPGAIRLGDRVVLDDGAVLDAKGAGGGITVGSDVFISRGAALACKDGAIELGSHITVGAGALIQSVGESRVRIGDYAMIAAHVYVIGCGDYRSDCTDRPMFEQGLLPSRGIEIERDVWLGANVVVCDGARIGEGAIIGAQSLVRGTIPPRAVAFGCPATVRRFRGS
jgi:acetyltransferase-like isoleucine patch superfamily enzyme